MEPFKNTVPEMVELPAKVNGQVKAPAPLQVPPPNVIAVVLAAMFELIVMPPLQTNVPEVITPLADVLVNNPVIVKVPVSVLTADVPVNNKALFHVALLAVILQVPVNDNAPLPAILLLIVEINVTVPVVTVNPDVIVSTFVYPVKSIL